MRILYGVTGEGLGHTMRARVLIEHLLARGHTLQIAASGRAAGLLARHGAEIVPIAGLSIVYADGGVQRARTLAHNARRAPRALLHNATAAHEVLRFDPQLVITDFDSFAYAMGRLLELPIVSVDHQHLLSRCLHPPEVLRALSYDQRLVRGLVGRKLPRCDRYIVSSFFLPPLRPAVAATTRLVGPIVRPALLRARSTQGEHILVYQTGGGDRRLLEALAELPELRFRVYGVPARPAPPHIEYRPFSEVGFIADLASARAVVANGGYTTLSEALVLGRPVLSLPIRHQSEQELNAAYLEHAGMGVRLRGPSPGAVRDGLRRLAALPPCLPVRAANDEATAALDDAIAEAA